jgi:hypothetical protein
MTPLVFQNNLSSCSHRESEDRNDRIAEPDAVYVVIRSMTKEFAGGLIASKKAIQDGRIGDGST